jgi:hypothetical protein
MMYKKITTILFLFLAACSSVPKNADKPIKAEIDNRRTEEEVLAIKPVKSDFKTWIFEQPVKIRLSPSPSSKIISSIDEGGKVNASIFSLGNGWSRIVMKDGTDGFFFGKFAREIAK